MIKAIKSVIDDKIKVYALFQFCSLVSIVSLFIVLALIASNPRVLTDESITNTYVQRILDYDAGALLSFSYPSVADRFASVLTYVAAIAYLSSFIFGLSILRFSRKTIYDMLFVLFFFIPLLANIIALLAQLNRLRAVSELPLDEQAIYDQKWSELTNAELNIKQNAQLDELNATAMKKAIKKPLVRRRK